MVDWPYFGYDFADMNTPEFRAAFLARLDETGLKITEVASRAGLPYDRVYNIKKREDASTSVETAIAISHSFGLTVEEFIEHGLFTARTDKPLVSAQAKILRAAIAEALGVVSQLGMTLSHERTADLVLDVAAAIKDTPDAPPAHRTRMIEALARAYYSTEEEAARNLEDKLMQDPDWQQAGDFDTEDQAAKDDD